MTNVDTNHNIIQDVLSSITSSLGKLFFKQTYDLLTVLRQPTPQKVSTVLTVSGTGLLGSGPVTSQNPATIWQCPMSHEAWVNRLAVTSPGYFGSNAMTSGYMILNNSLGQLVYFLPIGTNVAPVLFTEGRLSAPHLAAGESLTVYGSGLPNGAQIRFDLQLVLVEGVSPDTPRHNPRNMNILD